MEIPGYTTLEVCPVTPGCVAKRLFRHNETGVLYYWHKDGKKFSEHVKCRVRGSNQPDVAYLGKWYNKRTHRVRWLGPERIQRSVESHPKDINTTANDWEHLGTYISDLTWREL